MKNLTIRDLKYGILQMETLASISSIFFAESTASKEDMVVRSVLNLTVDSLFSNFTYCKKQRDCDMYKI